jgi:photosystem II stability/assembly factor-like uncharacterized protein
MMKKIFDRFCMINKKKIILFISVILALLIKDGKTQDIWEQTQGPFGGSVYAITSTPNGTFFAGTRYGGVHKSTDKGRTWQSSGMESAAYSLLAISDTTIFVGSYSSSLFRSTDAGNTWEIKNNGLPNASVNCMVYSSDGNIFASTSQGIYRTGNIGDQWVAVNTNLTDLNVNVLAITKDNILYAGTQTGGLFSSSSAGELWTQETNGIPVASVGGITVDDNDNIYVGMGSNDGVYLSTDDGTSWTNIGLTSRIITSLNISSGNVLYAGTWQSGMYYSLDGGNTWISSDLGFSPLNIETIHIDPLTDNAYGKWQ